MSLFTLDPRVRLELMGQRRHIGGGLVCAALSAILLAGTAKLIELTIDAVAQRNSDVVPWLALAVVGLFAVRYGLTRGQMLLFSTAANRMTANLRARLFRKLQRLPVSYFNDRRSGAIQSVLTNDVSVFQTSVTSVRDMIEGPLKIITGVGTMFYLQWQLALVSFLFFPVMTTFIQRNSRKMKSAQAEAQSDLAELAAVTQEQIQGVRTIKAFGAEATMRDIVEPAIEKSFRSQMNTARRIATLKPFVEFIGAGALALTVLVCGYLIRQDQLSVARLTAFMFALDIVNQGFRGLGSLRQTLAQVEASADRLFDQVLALPDSVDAVARGVAPESIEGRLEVRDLSFDYPDGTRALNHVSFVVEPGQTVALVGPSGAGKSTLIDLLLRFYEPSGGTILLDGRDISTIPVPWYRSQIGVVPQSTFLFAGSVADNIRLGKPDATEGELRDAAHAAQADAFLTTNRDGYKVVLGERGMKLSGGEAQRIAIARALVRDPHILILDEATSNLDAANERLVTQAFEESRKGRTTLLVAHRLTTAARADRIVLLDGGEVTEDGTHAELMARDGTYAALYRTFLHRVEPTIHV